MRILVVDDSLTACKVIKKVLMQSGYDVITASSGEEALELIVAQEPFDLMTIDYFMDGMDGYDLCLKVRLMTDEQKAEVPVIFITGKDSMDIRAKGFSVGACEFLSKENILGNITPAVDKLLKPDAMLEQRLLVIDDSAVFRKVIVNAMKEIFSHIDQATDGLMALEMIKADPDAYDFIIIDHDMPRVTGSEFTRVVRTELGFKTIPIVLVTGTQDRNNVLDFFKFGGTDCLLKPFIKEELHARVRAHVEKASLFNQLNTYVSELKDLNTQKDDYLAACSHDLKTPLGAVMGFTELAMEDVNQPEIKEDLQKVLDASGILAQLIDKITELYRIQTAGAYQEMIPLDLNEVLRKCLDINAAMAKRKSVELVYKELPFLPKVMGNELSLTRVINNLLSNALKFTKPSGKVEIRVAPHMDEVQLSVYDNGVGMSPATVDKLFQKFSGTTKPGTQGESGTGLGLLITQQIVAQHGGDISVESTEGEGTAFSFALKTVA